MSSMLPGLFIKQRILIIKSTITQQRDYEYHKTETNKNKRENEKMIVILKDPKIYQLHNP